MGNGASNTPKTITKNLTGQVIIITGANNGIGKETARILARTEATIILACRDPVKAKAAVDELKADTQNNNLVFMKLDLSSLKSIRDFAEEFKSKYQRLDILINNAAILVSERTLTKDGFEMQFGTNHLGPFHLTLKLLDVIKKTPRSRIINVSSELNNFGKMHWNDLQFEKGYGGTTAYSQSKLANIIFTKELQRRVEGSNIKVVSLHPGIIRTGLNANASRWYEKLLVSLFSLIGKPVSEGAKTSVYCALEDLEKLEAGAYYSDCKVAKENPEARKPENWTKLWEISEKLIASKSSS